MFWNTQPLALLPSITEQLHKSSKKINLKHIKFCLYLHFVTGHLLMGLSVLSLSLWCCVTLKTWSAEASPKPKSVFDVQIYLCSTRRGWTKVLARWTNCCFSSNVKCKIMNFTFRFVFRLNDMTWNPCLRLQCKENRMNHSCLFISF